MKKALFSRSLTRSAVACRCFVRNIGYCDATLVRHHATGNVTLELPWRTHYIAFGETRWSEKGVAITELISEAGRHYYVQSRAGDVWAMIHNLPQVSPELETAHAIAI